MLQMSKLKRNPSKVKSMLVEQKDASVYCKADTQVYLPKRWLDTPLLMIEERVYVVALLMVRIGNDYANYNISGMIELGVTDYQTVVIDNVECIEFSYEKGDIVFQNLYVAIDNTLPYYITNIIVKLGSRIPYFTYNEFIKIPLTFPKYSQLSIPELPFSIIYMAYLCRAKEDLTKRASLSKSGEYINIPVTNISLAVENTVNKISGGYLEQGIQGSAIKPSEKASMSEIIMRA